MAKLYEPCTLCRGSDDVEGFEHCPGCGSKGFIEIGLTTEQVERMADAERRRMGDPSAPMLDADALPDLLSAARQALYCLACGDETMWEHPESVYHFLWAAISKAEGEGGSNE